MPEKVSQKDLYRAMAWLLKRQDKIERRLAAKHLQNGQPVLYDLSSTYYEGSTCVLARRGHSRDGKKGTRQINFGLLCSAEGSPVAVEVFPGNTADSATVQAQVNKLKERFGMKKILLVGDRGMLTSARIEALRDADDISWISALQSAGVRKLAESGNVQMELFDQRDLVEVRCEEAFPGGRLVVCLNPALRFARRRLQGAGKRPGRPIRGAGPGEGPPHPSTPACWTNTSCENTAPPPTTDSDSFRTPANPSGPGYPRFVASFTAKL